MKGWSGGGCRVGNSSEDSSTMRNRWLCSFSYTICAHVYVRECVPRTLLLTHLDDRSCSLLHLGSDDTILKRFSSLRSDMFFSAYPPSFPSSTHPSIHVSFFFSARPCSGLHRGERVWDGVAVGLTGKQQFSPASKTSSQLSRVVPNVMKRCLGRLFSPLSTASKQKVIVYKPHI